MDKIIVSVDESSPLKGRACIGDALVSIDGSRISDVLDYKFYSYEKDLCITLKTGEGRWKIVTVHKAPGEDLGLGFSDYLMDEEKSCSNHCIFCFIDQLPNGMRDTLYFKDDDARLSFLTGNYITLTNLSEQEISKIINLRISPINISVHTTNPRLRARMLGNKKGADGFSIMQTLAKGKVRMNCQIVCCPGYNDGDELTRTMEDLAGLYPWVSSVSVVPVGLSRYREKLPSLVPHTAETAGDAIARVNEAGRQCALKYGSRVFYCADEFYIKAGQPIPDYDYYEDFPQLENGVGMLRLLAAEFMDALADETDSPDADILAADCSKSGKPPAFTIATGTACAPYITNLLMTAEEKCDKICGQVISVVNDFFGQGIDVAGLVTGADLINQLSGKQLGRRLLISRNMLRHGENVFLDDITIPDVENALNIKLVTVDQSGQALLDAMLSSG